MLHNFSSHQLSFHPVPGHGEAPGRTQAPQCHPCELCRSVMPFPGRFPDVLTRRKFWSASCTVAVGGTSNSADTVLFSSQPRWATCTEKRATWPIHPTPAQEQGPAQSLGAAPAPRRKPNPLAVLEYSNGVSKSSHRIQPDLLSLVPSQFLQFHAPGIWMAPNPNLPCCSHTSLHLSQSPLFSQPKLST